MSNYETALIFERLINECGTPPESMTKYFEGLSMRVYLDSRGVRTVGYGTNLDNPEFDCNAIRLLQGLAVGDLAEKQLLARSFYHVYAQYATMVDVNVVPYNHKILLRAILTDMLYNLGSEKFFRFKKTIQHIENKNYYAASKEMLNSRWAEQVGNRAEILSIMMGRIKT